MGTVSFNNGSVSEERSLTKRYFVSPFQLVGLTIIIMNVPSAGEVSGRNVWLKIS